MTTTVQGWTLSLRDRNGNAILENVETRSISVSYDMMFSNMAPFGDITAIMEVPLHQMNSWNEYATFQPVGGWNYAVITISMNGNLVEYNNAVLTSISWWSTEENISLTVNWKFSERGAAVATPPRELRKKLVEQKLDWQLYGF